MQYAKDRTPDMITWPTKDRKYKKLPSLIEEKKILDG